MILNFIDPISFLAGFVSATVIWFLISRARPLISEMRQALKDQRELAQTRITSRKTGRCHTVLTALPS